MSLRIRTVARLTGVREATLRAWEKRHGFPRPLRQGNNYRSYSVEEAESVRQVARLLQEGHALANAIDKVRTLATADPTHPHRERLLERFWTAARALDTETMERVLSEAQALLSPTQLCDDFLLVLLRDMSQVLNVACEHVGSALVRHRIRSVLQSMGSPPAHAPRALLACPTGERHEGALLTLGVHLRQRGWNPVILGADVPAAALMEAADQLRPSLIALSFIRRPPEREMGTYLRQVAQGARVPVIAGGPGTHGRDALIEASGVRHVTSVESIFANVSRRARAQAAQAAQ